MHPGKMEMEQKSQNPNLPGGGLKKRMGHLKEKLEKRMALMAKVRAVRSLLPKMGRGKVLHREPERSVNLLPRKRTGKERAESVRICRNF